MIERIAEPESESLFIDSFITKSWSGLRTCVSECVSGVAKEKVIQTQQMLIISEGDKRMMSLV